jgi:hypothetical protein
MDKTVSDIFTVLGSRKPDVVDLRDFEAPEPMEKVLLACSKLGAGEFFLAHLPRVPTMLFPHLEKRGLCWWVHEEEDHSALLLIRRDTGGICELVWDTTLTD